MRGTYIVFVRKPEDRRPICRHGRKLEDNIKMDLQGIEWARDKGMDGIYLALNRKRWRAVANTVMNFGFSYNAGHLVTRCEPVSFSRTILLPGVGV